MRRKDREVTDMTEIEKILLACKVCHVAMVDENHAPYVVPLSYGYKLLADGTLELYLHSAFEGKKMDILKQNNRVCFAITDEGKDILPTPPLNANTYFASVIGYGEVVFIEDPAEKSKGLTIMNQHQSGEDTVFADEVVKKVCMYKIVSKEFTGKKRTSF